MGFLRWNVMTAGGGLRMRRTNRRDGKIVTCESSSVRGEGGFWGESFTDSCLGVHPGDPEAWMRTKAEREERRRRNHESGQGRRK